MDSTVLIIFGAIATTLNIVFNSVILAKVIGLLYIVYFIYYFMKNRNNL